MDGAGWSRTCVALVVSVWIHVVTGSPIGSTTITCGSASATVNLGAVDEGYSGDVELVSNIPAGTTVKLKGDPFESHLQFLELNFTVGETTATVRTKKPLDADVVVSDVDRVLYYSLVCNDDLSYKNSRRLIINDINDNSPVFDEKFYSKSILEIHTVDTEVLRVRARDADSTPAFNLLTYTYTPVTPDFSLSNSGAFTLIRPLNYNVVPKYNFIVTATDSGGKNDTTSVEIVVQDFDNLNPFFSHSLYQAVVPENQDGDLSEIRPEPIKAQDGDTGINRTITYSITSVSPADYQANFNINADTGVLTVVTSFDREEMDSSEISVSIKAAQTDDPLKTADAVVSVTVQDVNDNAPEFDQSSYNISLLENSPANTVVFKAVVTDKDQGGFVGTLQILPESTSFSISPDGTVRVINPEVLDREVTETFVFQIEAKETEVPNQITTAQVTVSLLDENDNSPAFTSSMYEGQVFKNQTVGNLVVKVEAEDPDDGKNGEIQYSITFGNNDGYFSINASTGEISLANLIPLKENQVLEFPLYITARDGGTISRSTSAQAIIRAPGNSKPQFLQELYQGAVEEEQEPGALVVKVNFLAISSEPVTLQVTTEADKFSISNTGEVTTTVKLDHDDGPHNFSVGISISDGVTTDTAVVEVQVTDINDNSPVFASSSVSKSVPEDTEVGSNITEVAATDKDSGFNKEIRYSLRGGDGRFFIDPVSGMVSLAAALDRETTAAYELLVVAEDQGRPARSATATLAIQVTDVNDNTPRFSQPEYQVEVSETEAVGTSLLTLSAEDPDEGANGRVTYSISEQSPSSEPAVFQLDASSGILSLVQPLNYSEVKEFTLSVQASDGGSPSLVGNGSVVVKVKDVNNNPPKFSKERYDVAISENLASGASILTMEVTDIDEVGFSNGHFVYTSDTFDINNQGVVSLKKDSTLDRETKDSYMLQVVAVDQPTDGLSATAQLNITVLDYNDNSPQFPDIPYPLEIPEGEYSAENPGEIFTIQPTDADIGLNGEVTLSLSPAHPIFSFREDGMLLVVGSLDREKTETYNLVLKASDKGSPQREVGFSNGHFVYTSDTFDINNQGVVSLKKDSTLDRETKDSYMLQVVAVDQPTDGLSATAQLNITVLDYNDNSPQFPDIPYPLEIPEGEYSAENPGEIFTIQPTDADIGLNGEVTLSLSPAHPIFSFREDGMLLVVGSLDREKTETYNLVLKASDKGSPQRENITTISVSITDVNDNKPEFSSSSYETSTLVKEAEKGKLLLTLRATDKDTGNNSLITYSFSEGDSPHLALDSETGEVTLTSDLTDVTEDTTLVLTAEATDHGKPPLSATARVVVNIRIASLVDSVAFMNSSYNFKLKENENSGINVGQVQASAGSNLYNVSYELRTHKDLFSIDSDGSIVSTKELDKEEQEWYILDVEAVDTRTPPTSAVVMVRIQVEDVNEPPAFSSDDYEASVFSIAPYKTPVIQVKASDPDVGDNSDLVYSLSGESSSFDVEPASGLLYVVSAADLGGKTVSVEVKATDPDGLSATTTVKVVVQGSASSSDVTIISINQPANIVEKKVPELEEALGKTLGWKVNIIQVSSSGGEESRMLRESVKTLVSFVAFDGDEAVETQEVAKKLQSESEEVRTELAVVFGSDINFDVEINSPSSDSGSLSNQTVVIVLGVLLGLTFVALIVFLALFISVKKSRKQKESDRESFDINRKTEGYTNMNFQAASTNPGLQNPVNPYNRGAEDKGTTHWDRRADEDRTSNKGSLGGRRRDDSESDESHTSAL
ncbi:PREDICTED: cadherin-23-like [Poecilia mexicana]|uniref:cadherin-23-like n=1 Tax=Poecilia mexicana TaxID=48701 RepID=UPI00072E22CB|nr:PREDICTED: cadherin-23-like [Poecilia mexicana]